MAATVLNSALAVDMSVFVVRAFVRLREMLSTHKELAHKIGEPGKNWRFTMKPSSDYSRRSGN